MKSNPIYSFPILIVSIFLFWGCSQSPQEVVAPPEPKPEVATKDELTSGLASAEKKAADEAAQLKAQLADARKKADDQAAALKAEVSAALAKQKKELLSQMNANTSNLTSQMSGLKEKYESLKDSVPEEVLKVVKDQIPDLETSITKLKEMAAKFNPSSLEELNAFKTKYQKEYELALNLMKKASALLESSGVKIPKLF